MTLKPYRYWLPLMGISLSILLIALDNAVNTKNLLAVFIDELNFPGSVALQSIPGCCFQGHNVFGYRTWLVQLLFISLAGLWWYLVGLELDLDLLRHLARRWLILSIFWLILAAAFQILAIYVLAVTVIQAIQHPSDDMAGYLVSGLFLLMTLGWLELIAFKFWRAHRTNRAIG